MHREHQRAKSEDETSLIDALAALYAYVYGVAGADVQIAARERAIAMRHSDEWVNQGCRLESPLIAEERAALVRSYAGLLAAVHIA